TAAQVRELFERHVPEIAQGLVSIKAIAREPGKRAKVAIHSTEPAVDVIRACTGHFAANTLNVQRPLNAQGAAIARDGRRAWAEPLPDGPLKTIVNGLGGERIDLVRWSDSTPTFIRNAMGPARIDEVCLYPALDRAIVFVEEGELSMAIGRDGVNVRL